MKNEPDGYIPGFCNIGKDEVAKRKKELNVAVIITLALTVLSFHFYHSLFVLLLLFFSSAFTLLMYLQVRSRFCVLFGWIKKINFGKLGNLQKINDPGQIARDRKKVLVMLMQTLAGGVLYAGLIYLASGSFHF